MSIVYPVLHQGDTGNFVQALQNGLNSNGASPQLVVDGIFGTATATALAAFQTATFVDGIVDDLDWTALGNPVLR